MPAVETATGPVELEDLGPTLIHEHVCFRDDAVAFQWPHLYDEDALKATAVETVEATKAHGIRTIVEPTAMYGGRDIRFIKAVSEQTGVNLIPCTGIYTYEYLPFYWANRDVDAMADAFVHDIEVGIQGTEIKAGFLKCAADEPGVTENIDKVHRACARASVRTGAPIMAHSHPATQTGLRQIEIFREEGVEPDQIQIAHTGDTDDLDYIERVLDAGVFIGLDRYGLPMFLPTDKRNATLLTLLERGHVDQMFIGQDFCATIDWFPEEAVEGLIAGGMVDENWSMTLIFESVIPTLKENGMTDAQLTTMLEENPRRWLG